MIDNFDLYMDLLEKINLEQTFFNELYVGETPFIVELTKAISEARAPYIGKPKKPIKGNKDFIKIGDMIAKEFGFYSVTFTVPFDISMNAFTYPITYSFDKSIVNIKPKFFKDHGLKYDSSANQLCILVAVTAGVWFNETFTDREVVAAILHEIGHSFALQSERMVSIIETVRIIMLFTEIFNIINDLLVPNPKKNKSISFTGHVKTILTSTNKGKEIINQVSRKLATDPHFKMFNNVSVIINWATKIVIQVAKEILNLISGIGPIIAVPFAALLKIFPVVSHVAGINRSQEFLSDSFATMYGMGPEISSFLVKIELDPKNSGSFIDTALTKIPIIGALHKTLTIPYLYIADSINSHPSTPARIKKIINELNQELNNSDLDKKTKKAVQDNIKELEKIQSEIETKPTKIRNGKDVKRMWLSFLSKNGNIDSDIEKYYTDLSARDQYVKEAYDQLLIEETIN